MSEEATRLNIPHNDLIAGVMDIIKEEIEEFERAYGNMPGHTCPTIDRAVACSSSAKDSIDSANILLNDISDDQNERLKSSIKGALDDAKTEISNSSYWINELREINSDLRYITDQAVTATEKLKERVEDYLEDLSDPYSSYEV